MTILPFLTVLLVGATIAEPEPEASGAKSCHEKQSINGVSVFAYIGDRACHDFEEPRTFEGIWVNVFEGSRFYEGADSLDDLAGREEDIWFAFDDRTVFPKSALRQRGHAYRVRFDGRQTQEVVPSPSEGYGHFGMFSRLVLADTIIELDDLGPIPMH